jgi:hypothetical protein
MVIPVHGATGAAWVKVVTESLALAGRGAVFFVCVTPIAPGPLVRTVAAFLPVGVLLWLTNGHPALQACAMLAYVPAILLTGAVGREDWDFIRNSLGRRP